MSTILSSLEALDHEGLIGVLSKTMELLGPPGLAAFEQNRQRLLTSDSGASEQPKSQSANAQISQDQKDKDNKGKKKSKISRKPIDMSKFRQRHVALQIEYEGSDYAGFASQESGDGVENFVFAALEQLNLIESRKTCNYSRCGRTDKGVSALGQVVALHLRSAIPLDPPDGAAAYPLPLHPNASVVINGKTYREMDYVNMLNHHLPASIRVISWTAVTPSFSS
eukprot:gene40110-48878_t